MQLLEARASVEILRFLHWSKVLFFGDIDSDMRGAGSREGDEGGNQYRRGHQHVRSVSWL